MRDSGRVRQSVVITMLLIYCVFFGCVEIQASGAGAMSKEEMPDARETGNVIKDHQHVLVINAYHQGFGWTDDQTDAVISSFGERSDDTVVSVEYLDWKRYPYETNLRQQVQYLEYKYTGEKIDVVIATDDIGMQFAIDHRDRLFKDAAIVFTGVLYESAQKRMVDVSNITGVYESIDPEGTLEVMLELHKDLELVYIVSDQSVSSKGIIEQLKQAVKSHSDDLSYEVLDNYTYEEILLKLGDAPDGSAVLMGSFVVDDEGNTLPMEMFTNQMAKEIDVPIYTLYEFLLGHGVMGGSLLSGTLQGEEGAELAIRILDGEDADSIPVVGQETVFYGFDYSFLEKHNVFLTDLPEGSSVINKPVSVYEAYKNIIIGFMALLILMVTFIIILAINISLRRHAQEALEKEHQEVLETYEALSASEELLKEQNKELVQQQERINYLAYNDHLTDLPNRLQLKNYSSMLIEQSRIHDSRMVLVFIDLDNFNYVNTAHGHMVGDMMLSELASRFKSYINGQGTIGRIGGDEFVCLKGVDDDFELEPFVEGLMGVFDEPIHANHREVFATASMGYAIYPDDGSSYDELMIRADIAMYKMKDNGKSRASRFDVQMNSEMTDKINLTNALKVALQNDEFYLVFQPQYDLKNDRIAGFEALLRWESELLGPVAPNEFISIAESTGQIVEIGYFAIEEAFRFAKRMSEYKRDIRISVNISVIQLLRTDFADRVRSMVNRIDVNPDSIEFEITESVMIESFEVVNSQLESIRDIGIHIALDDFGTGYSSLTYLKKLPISTLKIDKMFIDDILNEGNDHFFTGTIIDIAGQLSFRTVAEGVEEEGQADYLRRNGCHIVQGYWYSRPVSLTKAIEMYEEQCEDEKATMIGWT